MFQEFQLSVTPLEGNRYLVRTEKVASGVPLAEEQLTWEVEDWLAEAQQLMSDPLVQVFRGEIISSLNGEANPSSPIAFGQKLYDALFQGRIRDSWIAAQSIAHNQRLLLRFRLGLKGDRLPRLPWEILHPGKGQSSCDRPLATGTEIAFSRYPTNLATGITYETREPVKMLMVLAGPGDRENLDLEQEARDLKAELDCKAETNPLAIDLEILPHPSCEQLTQTLEQGKYQIFHYAGHSSFSDTGGDIYLVDCQTELTETLAGEDLAGLLANNGVQLAVFNSCRGAQTARELEANSDRSLARSLIKCGIPAVLAMAERIPDEVAKSLTRLLYRNLNLGYPIDVSLSRARQGLVSAYGSDRLYWALPVLSLHPKFDGTLAGGENEVTLAEELLALDADEIPPEVLALGAIEGLEMGDEDEFLAPLPLPQADEDEPWLVQEATIQEDAEAEELVSGILNELAPASEESTAPPTAEPTVVPALTVAEPAPPPPRKKSAWGLGILGVLGIGAALAGGWWFLGRDRLPDSTPPVALQPQAPLDFAKMPTDTLTGTATQQLASGNLERGQLAVEELLEPKRNALANAKAALAAVPREQQDRPKILFLSGRIAWQSALGKDKDYSLDDARRYWESAARKAPKSVEYHNALGFAYYEEGDFKRANQAWSDALELAHTQTLSENRETLTTYAGLTLAFRQMSREAKGKQKQVLLDKVRKLRQVVMSEAAAEFQPAALEQNWLWSEKAIKDWQSAIAATPN